MARLFILMARVTSASRLRTFAFSSSPLNAAVTQHFVSAWPNVATFGGRVRCVRVWGGGGEGVCVLAATSTNATDHRDSLGAPRCVNHGKELERNKMGGGEGGVYFRRQVPSRVLPRPRTAPVPCHVIVE
jgi:hypothetical protein